VKSLGGKTGLKMNAGFARNVYRDEPYFLTENGIDAAGPFSGTTFRLYIGVERRSPLPTDRQTFCGSRDRGKGFASFRGKAFLILT
jgi:hypothetical protein